MGLSKNIAYRLRSLREAGLLHALDCAKTADGKPVRFTLHMDQTVVLESRDSAKKRPASRGLR